MSASQGGVISRASTSAVAESGSQSFDAAYRALRADPSIQFTLTPAPPAPEPPSWLRALGEFLEQVLTPVGRFISWLLSFLPEGPYVRALLWGVIALAALLLCWAICRRLTTGRWRLRKPREHLPAEPIEEWQPEAAPVRAWLREADSLADQGRFAEAIHCLLLRSVQDIAGRRPQLAKPSLTGRELASSPLLPPRVRGLFSGIAHVVERSLFGGRAVQEREWLQAREAYSEFALPNAWRS